MVPGQQGGGAARLVRPHRFGAHRRRDDVLVTAELSPLPAKERRLIIAGLGDRLAPPEQAEILWKHWDRCAFHWFPGNHVLHVSQPDYLRRMTKFLGQFMFD